MYKLMIWLGTITQLFISTSIELIGNERGEIVVDPKPVDPPVVDPVEPNVDPQPIPSKNELLRDLSKEYGVNLFEPEGLKKFKEFQDNQKTELEKAQELIEGYKSKETEWQSSKLKYESQLKASELGIPQDKLEDALKLAGGEVDKLDEIVKKYPIFKSKEGIKIGVTDPNNFQNPTGQTDAEKYMAQNPKLYKK